MSTTFYPKHIGKVARLSALILSLLLIPSSPVALSNLPSDRLSSGSDRSPKGMSVYPYLDNTTEGFLAQRPLTTGDVAPTDPSTMYLGAENAYVHFSHDGGASWHKVKIVHRRPPFQFLSVPTILPQLEWTRTASFVDFHGNFSVRTSLDPSEMLQLKIFQQENLFPAIASGVKDEPVQSFASSRLLTKMWRRPTSWSHSFEKPGMRAPAAPQLPDIEIQKMSINPNNAQDVIAATSHGLYRSRDGGIHWYREGDRVGRGRRDVNKIVWDPRDSDRRILCTASGVFETTNNGLTYFRVPDDVMSKIPCHKIYMKPGEPDEIWVGTVFGVWVSRDGGDTFDLNYVRNVSGQRQIHRVHFHPDNPDFMMLVAREGLFLTRDGGESYEKMGQGNFYNQRIMDAAFGERPGHYVIMTDKDLWRTTDGGESWEIVFFGNAGWHLDKFINHQTETEYRRWILSESELFRVLEEPPESSGEISRDTMDRIRKEMSLGDVILRTLKAHRVYGRQLRDYRRRSMTSNWLPEFQAGISYRDIAPDFKYNGLLVGDENLADPGDRGTFSANVDFRDWQYSLFAEWDLSEIISTTEELPHGPLYRRAKGFADRLRRRVRLTYMERRRLQLRQLNGVEEGPRAELFRKQRIQELTEQLKILTKGRFESAWVDHNYVEGSE